MSLLALQEDNAICRKLKTNSGTNVFEETDTRSLRVIKETVGLARASFTMQRDDLIHRNTPDQFCAVGRNPKLVLSL